MWRDVTPRAMICEMTMARREVAPLRMPKLQWSVHSTTIIADAACAWIQGLAFSRTLAVHRVVTPEAMTYEMAAGGAT